MANSSQSSSLAQPSVFLPKKNDKASRNIPGSFLKAYFTSKPAGYRIKRM